MVSAAGVSTDPSKIQAVQDWPRPTSLKELRGFLGLAGYYRKFIKNFALIAKPLSDLLRKDAVFVWSSIQADAFSMLKKALCSAPVLALPDFSQPFHIETDACAVGIGAVLQQQGHPLAFISKALGPRNQGLSTYEKEYLAILLAVEHWRHYLLQGEFFIHTDQRSLIHLNEQRLHTAWQQKVFAKLQGLQYKIIYGKGSENSAADALSRHTHPDQCLSVSSISHDWLSEVVDGYKADSVALTLLAQLALNPDSRPPYSLLNGVIRYESQIWLGSNTTLQHKVMEALHASPVGGHSGAPATYIKIKQIFFWKVMKRDIWNFVQSCAICLQSKPDRAKYPGLLQPLPIPVIPWEVISMDFIEGLPCSASYDVILVVVDKFSKLAHFIPLSHPFIALTVAKLFMENIYKLHGLPKAIISDRDKVFTSSLWQLLFKLSGTTLQLSSAYHPQTDGQTERVNQCLKTFLRCFVHACPHRWRQWLPLAEYWYNTSSHSALGRSPFEVLYGTPPRHLGLDLSAAASVPDLQEWLAEHTLMQDLVRQHLIRAQKYMKHQADKRRSDRVFAVNDLVFLKLQPYVQSSVSRRSSQKLSFKFFGPFKILNRIGSIAYRLELPPGSHVHPVFHVSQLRRSPEQLQVTTQLPSDLVAYQVPERILQRRWSSGHHSMEQVLVKWSHMPASLATWEDLETLKQRFLRGHAGTQDGGSVMAATLPAAPTTGSIPDLAHDQPTTSCRPRREKKPNKTITGPQWCV